MGGLFSLEINDDSVRFTSDGRISVVDAIAALCGHSDSDGVFESIANENPEILDQCKSYALEGEDTLLVADLEGWDKIVSLLAGLLLDRKYH